MDDERYFPYQSPLADGLTTPQDPVPSGVFLLPLCTTKERLGQLLTVLRAGADALDVSFVGDHSIDILEALAFVDETVTEVITEVIRKTVIETLDPSLIQTQPAFEMVAADTFNTTTGDSENEYNMNGRLVRLGGQWYVIAGVDLVPLSGGASAGVADIGVSSGVAGQLPSGGPILSQPQSTFTAAMPTRCDWVTTFVPGVLNFFYEYIDAFSDELELGKSLPAILAALTLKYPGAGLGAVATAIAVVGPAYRPVAAHAA